MQRGRFAFFLVGITLVLPVMAIAGTAIDGAAITTHATFCNVGVQVDVVGDDNRNASASFDVSVNGGAFQPGLSLSRVDDESGRLNRFVGSWICVTKESFAGVPYRARVVLSDPDGVTGGVLVADGRTRDEVLPISAGATIHVAPPPAGDDGNPGTPGLPLATIGRGLQVASPGDTVLLHDGIYHEQADFATGGLPGEPITLRAMHWYAAVLDGADPAMKQAAAWTDEGNAVFSAAGGPTNHVAVDGARLWRYPPAGVGGCVAALSGALPTDGGFCVDGGRVFVRLSADATPDGHEIQVAVLDHALVLNGVSDVVIRNLTVRHYGASAGAAAVPIDGDSTGVWLDQNAFESVPLAVRIRGRVDDAMISNNEFSDRGTAEFDSDLIAGDASVPAGALFVDDDYVGRGLVFFRNHVSDYVDGIRVCGDPDPDDPIHPLESLPPNDVDVLQNLMVRFSGAAIVTRGRCSNLRVVLNHVEDARIGVSAGPTVGGPSYYVYNLFARLRNVAPGPPGTVSALRIAADDPRRSGDVFLYHNTGESLEVGRAGLVQVADAAWSVLRLVNNLWIGREHAFEYGNGTGAPFDQDYDFFRATDGPPIVFDGVAYASAADYFDGSGECEHCLEGDPQLDSFWAPLPGSPAADVAVRVPGINDSWSGDGPDAGAGECADGFLCVTVLPAGFWNGTVVRPTTVTVELHDASGALVARYPGVLVEADGVARVDLLTQYFTEDFFRVVIRHPGYLPLASAKRKRLWAVMCHQVIDFKNPKLVACGEGALVSKDGRWAMPGGDAVTDGRVNLFDYGAVGRQWGGSSAEADFNGDGMVDAADAEVMFASWGKAACPEVP